MGSKRQILVAGIMLMLVLWPTSSPSFAREREKLSIGKIGYLHLKSKVKVGDMVLEPGRYQVQHLAQGDEHFMVFSELVVPARGGIIWPKEVGRAKCTVEVTGNKNQKTISLLSDNPEGVKKIEAIYVKGETVKHSFAN